MVWMTFGKKRPPLVPDPGQRVELLNENGTRRTGFRAVSGPLTTDKGVVVRVATEQEYQESRREGRRAVSMGWDIHKVVVPPLPWWRRQRWFTR